MIEVLNVTPAGGSVITITDPIMFDVRTDDPNVFTRIIVSVFYPGAQVQEIAYAQDPASGMGMVFTPFFSEATISQITDAGFQRYRFSVIRRTAVGQVVWPDSPKLTIYAFNDAGEEV